MFSRFLVAKPKLLILGLLLVLAAVRIPFYLTGHLQEDAYISLRCAESLAETGVYGFNPGERVSASTSHLYVFLAALVRLAVGAGVFIIAIQVFNTLLFLVGAFFITRTLMEGKSSLVMWMLISVLPISLLISYSGMETSLLVFAIGLAVYLLYTNKYPWLVWIMPGLMPWIRPDAVAYAFILIFWDCVRDKRIKLAPLVAVLGGVASLGLFNWLYFGSILNQSIIAKALNTAGFSLESFWLNLRLIFVEHVGGIFSPLRTKYLDSMGYLFFALTTAGILFYLLHMARKKGERRVFWGAVGFASMVYAVPVAYAAGGVIFPWYVWPSTFLGFTLLSALIVGWLLKVQRGRRILGVVLVAIVLGLIGGQWAYSYNWGTKERAFRGAIGEYLAKVANPGDTLFLEPAGYIPFYSGMYTYDEMGLASPLVVEYRREDPAGWWMKFVQEIRPDWIVQRGHILENRTYQGHELTTGEQAWFGSNYELVEGFDYDPNNYTNNPWLIRLLKMGEADEYYIFKLNP